MAWILAGDNSYNKSSSERLEADRPGRVQGEATGTGDHPPNGHELALGNMAGGAAWLDFLGFQSGHGDDANTLRWIHSGPPHQHWQSEPHRPVINLEPPYEEHRAYQSRQPHSAYNVRRAVYWSLLSTPPAGVTYGAHGIWSWQTEAGKEPTLTPAPESQSPGRKPCTPRQRADEACGRPLRIDRLDPAPAG